MEKKIHIATCHTCHFPIYRGDLVYHSSEGTHQGTVDTIGGSQDMGGGTTVSGSHSEYSGTSHSDSGIQCHGCYIEGVKESIRHTKGQNGGNKGFKGPFVLGLPTLLTFGGYLNNAKFLNGKGINPSRTPVSLKSYVIFGIGATFLNGMIIHPLLFNLLKWIRVAKEPFVDRYQFRDYRPGTFAENCYYCDKFIPKKINEKGSINGGVAVGGYQNIAKLKENRPICHPCGKEHEEK